VLIASAGPEVGDELLISLDQETVRDAVASLPGPERTVIRMRHWLDDDAEPITAVTVGRPAPKPVEQLEEQAPKDLAFRRELIALREAASAQAMAAPGLARGGWRSYRLGLPVVAACLGALALPAPVGAALQLTSLRVRLGRSPRIRAGSRVDLTGALASNQIEAAASAA
jgi:hypothetical protein